MLEFVATLYLKTLVLTFAGLTGARVLDLDKRNTVFPSEVITAL